MGPMDWAIAAHREWLAWRASGNHFDIPTERTEIETPRINLMHRPTFHRVGMVTLILAECLASVVIPFNDGRMLKSSVRHADGEPSRPCE